MVLLEPEYDMGHKRDAQKQLAAEMRQNGSPRIWVVVLKEHLAPKHQPIILRWDGGALGGQGQECRHPGVPPKIVP